MQIESVLDGTHAKVVQATFYCKKKTITRGEKKILANTIRTEYALAEENLENLSRCNLDFC